MYCSRCGTRAAEAETLCAACGAALQLGGSPVAIPPVPAPVPDPTPGYAGFWRRCWAAIVDLTVLAPFGYSIEILLGHRPFDPVVWDASYWSGQIATMGLYWLYGATFESSQWQGTLGQQLLAIRVTGLHGRRISFARASARHVGQYLSVVLLGTGYLMIAFTARKQALHDMISGCLLIRRGVEAPAGAMAGSPLPGVGGAPPAGAGL